MFSKKRPYLIFDKSREIEEDDPDLEKMREQGFEPEFRFYPLYRKSQNGNEEMWQIGYRPDEHIIFTIWGVVDGKMQRSEDSPEAKGKKSEFEQALQVIRKNYEDKIDRGYAKVGDEEKAVSYPMLAATFNCSLKVLKKGNKYAKKMAKIIEMGISSSEDSPKKKKYSATKLTYPIAMSAKLDGMRMLVRRSGDNIIFRTRENKIQENFNLFEKAVKMLFKYLPDNCELDGELYGFISILDEDGNEIASHGNFQDTMSVVRTTINRDEDTDRKIVENIKYCIFDSNMEGPFEYRFWKLLRAFQKLGQDKEYIKYCEELKEEYDFGENTSDLILLLNNFMAETESDILEFQEEMIDLKYEGTMLKNTFFSNQNKKGWKKSLYKGGGGRTNNIFKFKYFYDDEGIILSVYPGKTGKERNLAMFKIKAKNGKIFDCRPANTEEERKWMLKHKDKLKGKEYTYKHYGVSKDGIPKFPTGLRFRDEIINFDEDSHSESS